MQALLNLKKNLNKDVIGERLKLQVKGSLLFQEYTFEKVSQWIEKSNLTAITIDCDSTIQTVYGNQEGAAKGYNPGKKGAKSYHSLLAFISQMRIVVNNRFRTGSASYTSNGILSFIEQTAAILPAKIKEVFSERTADF